jgi:hypothetical protein
MKGGVDGFSYFSLVMSVVPRYSWNIAKVGVKYQSINYFIFYAESSLKLITTSGKISMFLSPKSILNI